MKAGSGAGHAERRDLGTIQGVGRELIEYLPGESNSSLFGGNSNWRGPIWMPTNYTLIQAIEKYHRYLGDGYKLPGPCLGNPLLTLKEIATWCSVSTVSNFRPTGGRRATRQRPTPANRRCSGAGGRRARGAPLTQGR